MAQKKDSFFLAPKSGKPKLKSFKRSEKDEKVPNTSKQIVKGKDKKPFDKVRKENDEKVSNIDKSSGESGAKKPFDKKVYRLKKYSNKYKLEKWEDQRKKKLLRNYYKEVKNDAPVGSYKPVKFDEDSDDRIKTDESIPGKFVRHPDLIDKDDVDKGKASKKPLNSKEVKRDAFWRAKEEFVKLKQSKVDKKKEMELKKKEREEKMLEYQRKKAEKFKKLNRKTRKGQPVMTGRLELLLEKIEQNKLK